MATMEDRLHVLDVDVSVEGSARIGDRFQSAGQQRIAICNKTHVVAIANGRFVDLYGVDSNRFTFLTQISLGDYVKHSPSGAINEKHVGDDPEMEIVVVTCVAFPTPGFMLVGGAVVALDQDLETSTEVESHALLLGFRLYSGSASRFSGHVRSETPRNASALVQVHFSFLEPIVGTSKRMSSMQPIRRDMTPDSGAVVLVFEDSDVFGVFNWRERFSDRQVCLAQLTPRSGRIVAAATSSSGRYLVFGDAEGRLRLLDFRDYPWGKYGGVSSGEHQIISGKRLQLGLCSRSGVVARDNSLEHVRLVHTTAGTDARLACTSTCWWSCNVRGQTKEFVFAGKQDGSLSVLQLVGTEGADTNSEAVQLKMLQIYPGLASGKHDAIRIISEPQKTSQSISSNAYWLEFFTISEMRWRVWRAKIEGVGSSSKQYRLIWPSLKDSLDFVTFNLSIKDLSGIAVLAKSTEFSQTIAKAFSVANPDHTVRGQVSLVIAENRLQVVGVLTKSAIALSVASSASESDAVTVNEDDVSKSDDLQEDRDKESHDESTGGILRQSQKDKHGPTTIQDKYKLPPMEWKNKSSVLSAPSRDENATPSKKEDLGGATGTTSRTSKLSRVDYDTRVESVIRRVDNLSGVMKTMRTSFQLFSRDVQQHMNLVSEQLEELSRRRVAHESK